MDMTRADRLIRRQAAWARLGLLAVLVLSSRPTAAVESENWRDGKRCGVNSVYLMLRLEGSKVPYETVLQNLAVTESGTSMQDVSDALTQFGLKSQVVKATPAQLARLRLPCVAHVEIQTPESFSFSDRGHYVVLLKVTNQTALYLDGTTGIIQEIALDEFTRVWTGYLVIRTGWPIWDTACGIALVVGAGLLARELLIWKSRMAGTAEKSTVVVTSL